MNSLLHISDIDLTDRDPDDDTIVIGRHALWVVEHQQNGTGFKFPFQFGGRVQKYRRLDEQSYPRETIGEEVAALLWLADQQMAPRPLRWVFSHTCISEHAGAWWADPLGLLGYEMQHALALPPGRFSVENMRASGMFTGSPGAWSDLAKPGNVINGYLVDVRRSWWDRLQFHGSRVSLPDLSEDVTELQRDLRDSGQFPFKERELPYQEYLLHDEWQSGERDVRQRAVMLGLLAFSRETVLDIGCHVGGFLQKVASRGGQTNSVGVDVCAEYIALARRLARANGFNHCFRQFDAERQREELYRWISKLWPGGVDHLLLLSLSKHFVRGDATVFQLIDSLRPRWAYLESNAVNAQNPYPMKEYVMQRGGVMVGTSADRNTRRLYRIARDTSC